MNQVSLPSTSSDPQSPVYLNPVVNFQKSNINTYGILNSQIARVLIIYTGGTIGMKALTPGQGYTPIENWLSDTLEQISRFNDRTFSQMPVFTEAVQRSSDGIITKTKLRALTSPLSIHGKRVQYFVLEYNPLLDSANMTISDWVKIGSDIELNYKSFDAFLILHGTDTMAYTASALSFMLEELGKTVIMTGSQVPLAEWRTDAEDNLLGALMIAGHYLIPEVCLYFNHKLFRGNRSTKVDAINLAAFDSPNLKPLATVGVNVDIHWDIVRRVINIAKFNVHKRLNLNVVSLRLFPGISAATVSSFLAPPVQGVVLETYGVGNIPSSRTDLLVILQNCIRRGVVVVNCTQCRRGLVSDVYATGKILSEIGVVPGADMTSECALTKLSYLLGKDLSTDEVRRLMSQNLRGELTNVEKDKLIISHNFGVQNEKFLNVIGNALQLQTIGEQRSLIHTLGPYLVCAAILDNDMETLSNLTDTSNTCDLINTVDYQGRTPLHIASYLGNVEMAKHLLLLGASVHKKDNNNNTPLLISCCRGYPFVSNLLVNAGAYLDSREASAKSLFMSAVIEGNVESVKSFMEAGLEVDEQFLELALGLARHCNQGDIQEQLISHQLPNSLPNLN